MKVYLAGPEVFLQTASSVFAQKRAICAKYGVHPITPFDNEASLLGMPPRDAARLIYDDNIRFILEADAVIANITPFRGPHMDPGTAFEIGYAMALGKKVACYTQDSRNLLERVAMGVPVSLSSDSRPIDASGYYIEDFGMGENLMIKAAVHSQGRQVIALSVPVAHRFTSIDGFEEALQSLLI